MQVGSSAWLAIIGGLALQENVEYDELVLFLRVAGRRTRRFVFSRRDVHEAAWGRKELVCDMGPMGVAASILVLGPAGAPRAGVVCTLIDARAWAVRGSVFHARTETDGRARLADLQPDIAYAVVAFDPGSGNVGLLTGWRPDRDATIRLQRARSGRFAVVLDDGTPAYRPSVKCLPRIPGLVPSFALRGDDAGVVVFENIVPGFYRLEVRARKHREFREPWTTHKAERPFADVVRDGKMRLDAVR